MSSFLALCLTSFATTCYIIVFSHRKPWFIEKSRFKMPANHWNLMNGFSPLASGFITRSILIHRPRLFFSELLPRVSSGYNPSHKNISDSNLKFSLSFLLPKASIS